MMNEEMTLAMRKMYAAKLFIHASDYAMGIYVESKKKKPNITKYNEFKRNEDLAKWWLYNDEDTHPASFRWICELLDIDYERTRSKIICNWRDFLQYNAKSNDRKSIASQISAFGNDF